MNGQTRTATLALSMGRNGAHGHRIVAAVASDASEGVEWKAQGATPCIDAERVKAVFITDRGVSAFNVADGALKQSPLPQSPDSRVEIISSNREAMDGFEAALMDCVASRP